MTTAFCRKHPEYCDESRYIFSSKSNQPNLFPERTPVPAPPRPLPGPVSPTPRKPVPGPVPGPAPRHGLVVQDSPLRPKEITNIKSLVPPDPSLIYQNKGIFGTTNIKTGLTTQSDTIKSNSIKLTPEQLEKAHMAQASRVFDRKGIVAAQDYLHDKGINWKIDADLSNSNGLVLTNNEGDTKVAYRGTEATNKTDLLAGAGAVSGLYDERVSPIYKSAQTQIDAIKAKYGANPSELIGFSLGGNLAIHTGTANNIKTFDINPLISNQTSPGKLHRLLTIEHDPVSIRARKLIPIDVNIKNIAKTLGKQGLRKIGRYQNVQKLIDRLPEKIKLPFDTDLSVRETVRSQTKELAPAETWNSHDIVPAPRDNLNTWTGSHELVQVLDNDSLPRFGGGNKGTQDFLNQQAVNTSGKLAEYNFLDGIKDSKTFEEYVAKNVRFDRLAENSKPVTEWERYHGPLTAEQKSKLLPPSKTLEAFNLNGSERDAYMKMTPEQQNAIKNTAQTNTEEAIQKQSDFLGATPEQQTKMTEQLNREHVTIGGLSSTTSKVLTSSLNPTSLTTGFMTSAVASGAAQGIASEVKDYTGVDIGPAGTSGLSGGLTTVFSGGGLTQSGFRFDKSVLSSGNLAGGVTGGVAQYYTGKGISEGLKKLGANQETQASLSDIGGSAVGSATTFATKSFIDYMLEDIAISEVAGGVETAGFTFGTSLAIAAATGAVIGAIQYGLSKIPIPTVHFDDLKQGAKNLVDIIKNKQPPDPYYPGELNIFASTEDRMAFLQNQSKMEALQKSDESKGITAGMRDVYNKSNYSKVGTIEDFKAQVDDWTKYGATSPSLEAQQKYLGMTDSEYMSYNKAVEKNPEQEHLGPTGMTITGGIDAAQFHKTYTENMRLWATVDSNQIADTKAGITANERIAYEIFISNPDNKDWTGNIQDFKTILDAPDDDPTAPATPVKAGLAAPAVQTLTVSAAPTPQPGYLNAKFL